MEHVCRQMRFDWQTFAQELLVEVFALLLAHQNTATAIVMLWSARPTHHLQNVRDRVVDVSMLPALVILNAHDDDHIAREGQTPRRFLVILSNSRFQTSLRTRDAINT